MPHQLPASRELSRRIQGLHDSTARLIAAIANPLQQSPRRGRMLRPDYAQAVQDLAECGAFKMAVAELAAFDAYARHVDPQAELDPPPIDFGKEGAWGDRFPPEVSNG